MVIEVGWSNDHRSDQYSLNMRVKAYSIMIGQRSCMSRDLLKENTFKMRDIYLLWIEKFDTSGKKNLAILIKFTFSVSFPTLGFLCSFSTLFKTISCCWKIKMVIRNYQAVSSLLWSCVFSGDSFQLFPNALCPT